MLLKPLQNRLFSHRSKCFDKVNYCPPGICILSSWRGGGGFSLKSCNRWPPQDTPRSTDSVKLVEWAIWLRVRKWVQHTRHLIAAILFSFSSMSSPWSCCMTEPSCDVTRSDVEATSLMSFHLLNSLLPIPKGFATETPPVCCMELSAMACLQTRQKAPPMSSSDTSQLNTFSKDYESFLLLAKGQNFSLQAFFEGGSACSRSESE